VRRFVIATLVAAATAVATVAAAAVISSASGSGHILFGTNEEFITFSAENDANGTATGMAVVHDVTAGVTAKIDVNCLNVVGNVATISGIVTKSNEPTLVGFEGVFQVVDNGEGGSSPDLMSLANFHEVGVGSDCSVPAEFDLAPLTSGNVQVR
jgi:hypothetical protein